MAAQQFCLKWNNHTNNMLEIFNNFLTTEALVDVTLACDGLSLKAHKIVLSACSPFFQSLFLENPCQHPIVIMKGINYKDLKAIVDFMYRGEVNVTHNQLAGLLGAAEILKVKGLADENCSMEQNDSKQDCSTEANCSSQPKRVDSPPVHSKRKKGRKRSLSDSNSSENGMGPKGKDSNSSEVEALSESITMREDKEDNVFKQSFSSSQNHMQSSVKTNCYSSSKHSFTTTNSHIEAASSDDEEFELEPSKLLEQSLTTGNVSSESTVAVADPIPVSFSLPSCGTNISMNTKNQASLPVVSAASTELLQRPETPPDIKPIITTFDESTSTSVMCLGDLSAGPSNYQADLLMPCDDQSRGIEEITFELEPTSDDRNDINHEIEELIRYALPQIPEKALKDTVNRLEVLGVTIDNLQYVREIDLLDILKPIQIRKLLACWSSTFSANDSVSLMVDYQNSTVSSSRSVGYDWVTNFEIPWHDFPKEIISACEAGMYPPKKYILQMIRTLCSRILKYDTQPGRRILRVIAQKIVQRYPKTFSDYCGGTIVAGGYTTIMKRLENCVDNTKRLSKSTFESSAEETDEFCPKRRKISRRYGCVNWQLQLSSNETKETQVQKKLWLREEYNKTLKNTVKIREYMQQTYPSQRHFINFESASIVQISQEWPFLLMEEYLAQHCNRLLDFDLEFRIKENLRLKGKKIYNFMRSVSNSAEISATIEEIETAKLEVTDNAPEIIGCIHLLLAYFGETRDVLFKTNMEHTTANLELAYQPSTPFIASIGGSIYTSKEFVLVIDHKIMTHVTNFMSAVKVLFAAYYVFNLEYPADACITLEFIQRCFAELNPDRGTKAPKSKSKRQHNVHPAILKLVNRLKDFESIF